MIAQDARERLGLDRLYFVPAAQAPLKDSAPRTEARHRLAMTRLAAAVLPGVDVLDDEIRAGGVSYTVDTARLLRGRWPDAELFWIVGADQVAKLPRWREIGELVRLVTFAGLERPGCPPVAPPAEAPPGLRLCGVRGHAVDISSSEIRDRLRSGLSIDLFVPAGVRAYISENALYTKSTHGS